MKWTFSYIAQSLKYDFSKKIILTNIVSGIFTGLLSELWTHLNGYNSKNVIGLGSIIRQWLSST